MLKHPEITKGRFARFARELAERLYPQSAPLAGLSVFAAPGRITCAEAMKGKYRAAKIGEQLGPPWSTHWFRIAYAVPREWRGKEVLLHFDSTSEGCVWRDGAPLQGLTGYNWKPQDVRCHFRLAARARGGGAGDSSCGGGDQRPVWPLGGWRKSGG